MTRIRDVAWTATMGGKVAGSNLENTNSFYEISSLSKPSSSHEEASSESR